MQDEPKGNIRFSHKMSLKGWLCMRGVDRQNAAGKRLSLEQIRAFLENSDAVQFAARDRQELYAWVGATC